MEITAGQLSLGVKWIRVIESKCIHKANINKQTNDTGINGNNETIDQISKK